MGAFGIALAVASSCGCCRSSREVSCSTHERHVAFRTLCLRCPRLCLWLPAAPFLKRRALFGGDGNSSVSSRVPLTTRSVRSVRSPARQTNRLLSARDRAGRMIGETSKRAAPEEATGEAPSRAARHRHWEPGRKKQGGWP